MARRVIFIKPQHYCAPFISGYPSSNFTDSEIYLFNGDNNSVEFDTTGEANAILVDWKLEDKVKINYALIENHNFYTANDLNGYVRLRYDGAVNDTYTSDLTVLNVYGDVREGASNNVYIDSNEDFLINFTSTVSWDAWRFYSWSAGSFNTDISIQNLWIGEGLAPGAIFSYSVEQNHDFIVPTYQESLSGVPYQQISEAKSTGHLSNTHTLNFEWIDDDDLALLRRLYKECGVRPFKMVIIEDDDTFEHYTVMFTEPLNINKVNEEYSNATLVLGEL